MDDGTVRAIIDHWQPAAMITGALATVRLCYRGVISLSIATWERNQLREQITILETRVKQLKEMVDGEDSGPGSNAISSARPGLTRTRIRPTRRSSRRLTGSSSASRAGASASSRPTSRHGDRHD